LKFHALKTQIRKLKLKYIRLRAKIRGEIVRLPDLGFSVKMNGSRKKAETVKKIARGVCISRKPKRVELSFGTNDFLLGFISIFYDV
jgi:hypothetical protein